MVVRARLWSAIALGTVCAPGAVAQTGDYGALGLLERGEWQLVERGAAGATRRICLGDPAQLLQPRHPGRQCKRFLLENSTRRVAITYDCAHAGQGRTALHVETGRLIQIDAQGVSDGTPFAMSIEGRRVGACQATALGR
ncbi:MAG TPA: hypothetical protein VFF84_10285 [Sphingobium sp.]|nr:hypothetical protein [Sphingobium sp.]